MSEPIDVYVEAQIDDDSISLSLLSESRDGARVEDTARVTFDELQERAGDIFNLRLSPETREQMVGEQDDSWPVEQMLSEDFEDLPETEEMFERISKSAEEMVEEMEEPSEGDVMVDTNAPEWSQDNALTVVEYLPHITCDEYVIDSLNSDSDLELWSESARTVADANPSFPADDAVITARYEEGGDVYAFPESRLEQKP